MTVRDMKQKSVNARDFAMIPRAEIPRSGFPIRMGRKVPFSAGYIIPIFLREVLPGDTWNVNCQIVCRTQTPIVPIMDNWHLETFFFFEPNRLIWTNWEKFNGAQDAPGDSISFTIPQVVSPNGGFAQDSIYDYYGLPCAGQTAAGNTISVSSLPFRGYNHIYNEWFRDENLIATQQPGKNGGDGPDASGAFSLYKRGKRHDYFTSCLPFVQKGSAVTIPLGTQAIVKTSASELLGGVQPTMQGRLISGAVPGANFALGFASGSSVIREGGATGLTMGGSGIYPTNLFADLSTASAQTINTIRLGFQTQKLLERDARGGTRYTEIVRSHFGVLSPDARLDRPEFLGGGHTPITTAAIPQTSATGLTGGTTPAGNLAATGYAQGRNGFSYSATEHGYIHGFIMARADLNYQQGIERHWKRTTRYDFYLPVFQALGEQSVFNYEIYSDGSATDALTFGYQQRWEEYRNFPSTIVGRFRSRNTGTIDYWHTAINFVGPPSLNATFIQDLSDTTMNRNFTAGATTAGQQFLADIMFTGKVARPMPAYSVPGMVDHF